MGPVIQSVSTEQYCGNTVMKVSGGKAWLLAVTAFLCLVVSVFPMYGGDTVWHDASRYPLIGKAGSASLTRYERLPAALQGKVRDAVWYLGRNSAGLAVRFRSNSTSVKAQWTSMFSNSMNHMTETGVRGLDLYVLMDGKWRFAGSGRPGGKTTEAVLVSEMTPEFREYMLYLSLYDGVDSLEIGVDEGAVVEMPAVASPSREKPVVMYGTSILQGGCASRPGMAHTNIIGRCLDREVINLGFSGNGRLDLYIAEQMATLDPTLYFLDFVPNCTAEMIDDRAVKFIEILRKAHPDTPIIMADSYDFPPSMFDLAQRDALDAKTKAMKRVCEHFKNDPNFIFIEGVRYCNDECSVDGVHLTDMGFQAMSEHYARYIEKAIRKASKNR